MKMRPRPRNAGGRRWNWYRMSMTSMRRRGTGARSQIGRAFEFGRAALESGTAQEAEFAETFAVTLGSEVSPRQLQLLVDLEFAEEVEQSLADTRGEPSRPRHPRGQGGARGPRAPDPAPRSGERGLDGHSGLFECPVPRRGARGGQAPDSRPVGSEPHPPARARRVRRHADPAQPRPGRGRDDPSAERGGADCGPGGHARCGAGGPSSAPATRSPNWPGGNWRRCRPR